MPDTNLSIRFEWVRDPERRFRLWMAKGRPTIAIDSQRSLREFEVHYPLDPKTNKPILSAAVREMLILLDRRTPQKR